MLPSWLSTLEPALTGAGSSAPLQAMLAWTRKDPDPWTGSALTMYGCPIEFAYSSADPGSLRYCLEIANPRSAAEIRLRQALEVLGCGLLDEPIFQLFQEWQSSGPLRYGCWVGVRHSAGIPPRCKLYIEIPEASSAAVLAWSEALSGCPMPSMPGQSFHIAMIGYDLASNRVEFYHRSVDLLPTALGLLLRRAGLEHRSREMFDLLQRAYRFPLASRLPARDVGFSYSMPLSGKEPIPFTLYFYCRSLFGGDDAARARLLKLASEYKWNLSHYASATGSMRPTAANRVHHGMFGVGLAENQPMAISVGIAPQIHPGGNPLQ